MSSRTCQFGLSLLLVLPAVLLLSIRPARAQLDGVSEVGHSYQSDARGGCETAIGDTALAHIRQPASVMLQPEAGKFDSKITNIFPINQWSDENSSAFSTINQTLAYNLGAVHRLGEKTALGVAWETGGWGTRFNNGYIPFPRRQKTNFALNHYSIYSNLGRQMTEKWFVGGGFHVEIAKFNTNMVVQNGILKWPIATSAGGAYQLGSLYKVTKKFWLGASYASSVYMGGITAHNASFSVPGVGQNTGTIHLKPYTLPGRVSFGTSYRPTEKLKLATEAGYLNYRNSFWGNARVSGLINGSIDNGYRDVWVINNGLDYDFSRNWSGSVGYVWNSNPISPRQFIPMASAIAQNQITWGLRYNHGRWWTGFAHIIGMPQQVHSTPVTHLAFGADYQHSTIRQMLQSFNCGVGFCF